MIFLLLGVLSSYVSIGLCGDFLVTSEAWFEIKIKDYEGPGEDYVGRFTVALFGETAPITVLNFKSLAQGHKKGKQTLHYKGSNIHRIVPDFVVQMGDITKGDGTGGMSIYGKSFADEEFILSHRSPGWVAMANSGADSNNSQFYITLTKARWLDSRHLVFGKVIRGMDVINILGEVPTADANGTPKKLITITDSGVNLLERNYEMAEDQLDSQEDL